MPFIEAPTTFYLGRRYDPVADRLADDVVYYDSRDLTTHAVVVGMTGSGKTGLCVTLLEEAILDNIPAIIIDPKGDITNLLLTFPDLQPQEFQPWVNVDDARRAGMDVPSFAADVAQRWRDGLQSWGIVPDRIRWLKAATQYSIYTPGSDAGLPISIVASLKAPRVPWETNEEAIREQINGITTALLALTGVNAEPLKDPEHVLIANIFEYNWRQGIDLTLEEIILEVQKPPFSKLGVFPVDQFMSERKRNNLAMDLNNIIASPSFQSWINGQPLDIQSLLYQPNGRPRVSIFYTAHLSDQERTFITTLILENMLSWMRTLSGTTSLRALLYIDEVFGMFPPYPRNPPTKEPILRLLKQARAFGIGLILATQNPGDLDYKGLTNMGTWFIGRLQSDNDRKRVMDGLRELATAQDGIDLDDVEQMVADIAPRVFLMRNVHDDDGPTLVHTRWAMSFLRGPLTRQQVEVLMRPQRQQLLQQMAGGYVQQQNLGWTQQSGATPPPSTVPGQSFNQPGMTPPPATVPGQSFNRPGATPPPATVPGMPNPTFSAQNAGPGPNWQQQNYGQQGFGQPQGFGGGGYPRQDQATANPAMRAMSDSQRIAGVQLPEGYSFNRSNVSSSIAEFFLPQRMSGQQAIAAWEQRTQQGAQAFGGMMLVYKPVLVAQAVVRYQDRKASIYTSRTYAYHVPEVPLAGIIHWDDFTAPPINARAVQNSPAADQVAFGDLEPGMTDSKRMTALKREVTDMLYNTARLVVPVNPELKVYGDPDADFSVYQSAVAQAAREGRDAEMDKISRKYAAEFEKLEDRVRRKEQELRAERKELQDRQREELFTTGEALLSLWQGRTNYTLSRMSRATRYKKQTKEDIVESREFLEEAQQQDQQIQQEFQQAVQAINQKWTRIANDVQEHVINPYKKDIQLELFGVGWVPHWYTVVNGQALVIPAF